MHKGDLYTARLTLDITQAMHDESRPGLSLLPPYAQVQAVA
jgi:hypothetical protein